MASNVTLSKNSVSVTIQTESVADNIKNELLVKAIPTVSQSQSTGSTTLIADLLRNIRTFMIKGYITSNSEKSDLISIIEGAGTTGGTITLTYSEGGDDTSFEGYIESVIFTQETSDEPGSPPSDFAKFVVQVTFVKGTQMGGT